MVKGKRRSYTQEYKEEAVKLVTEQGYKISKAPLCANVSETLSPLEFSVEWRASREMNGP